MNRKDYYISRNLLYQSIREFFEADSYIEVESPIMVRCPGAEVHLEYFSTQWLDFKKELHKFYLRSSPEIQLKQLVSEELPKIFEFAKSFRNYGELSRWHTPEFTLLEWYDAQKSFHQLIEQTIDLFRHVHKTLSKLSEQTPKWTEPKMVSISEAFEEWVGIELIDLDPDLCQKAIAAGVRSVQKNDDFETAYFKCLIEKIEPQLTEGIFCLFHFPPSQAALARTQDNVANRFEFYWNGVELCNAFDELSGMEENLERFSKINSERKVLGKEIIDPDSEFFDAVANLPRCCGNALGVDRLHALMIGQSHIQTSFTKNTFGSAPDS